MQDHLWNEVEEDEFEDVEREVERGPVMLIL
jgi:hypothetical protein